MVTTPRNTFLRIGRAWQKILTFFALLLVGFAVCEWLEWPFLRGPLERTLAKGLARPVTIGEEFGLRLLGAVHVHSDRFVIGAAPDGPALLDDTGQPREFLQAQGVRLALPYSTVFALARGRHDQPITVASLDVRRLEVNLVRKADGSANWHFGPPRDEDAGAPQLPRFERLVVQEGALRLDDAVMQVGLDVALHTQEGAQAERRLEATASGHYRKSSLKARLESAGLLPLVAPDAQTPPVPVKLSLEVDSSKLDIEGKVGDLMHLASLDARFRVAAPSLAAIGDSLGLTLPTTAPFLMAGHLGKSGALWSAGIAEFTLGSSRLRGDFRYDTAPPQHKLTGHLGGTRLALPDLAPAFGAPKTKGERAEVRGSSGRVLPQREFDIPSLAEMDADVTVRLDTFYLGTPQLESLAPLDAHVVLREQRLTVENIVARSGGGEVRGAFGLDARKPDTPLWSADLRWSGIELERFIKARDTRRVDPKAQADKQRGAQSGYVSGALSGGAQLRGSGRSAADMLASLDGSTQMWVRNGRISHLLIEMSGIDLAESLGLVVRGDAPLPVRCAVTRLVVKNGVMTPEVAVVDTADTTLVTTGSVSLAGEKLDLMVTARPRDMSPLALRGPLHIEGSFAHPDVHLDKQAIGLRVAAAAALATIAAPLAGLLAFIDLGEEDKAVCSDAASRLQGAAPRAAAKSAQKSTAASQPAPTAQRAPVQEPSTHRTQP